GQIWRHRAGGYVPAAARRWLDRLAASSATVLTGRSVIDVVAVDGGFALGIEGADEPRTVYARSVVLATGARERFLPFPGWTLPGVAGIGGAQALVKQGAESFRGKRVVIAGTGP